jgi:hypothetical protein
MDINYALAIMQMYPDVIPSVDFRTVLDVDGSQYIAEWNLDKPQPTEEELQIAWTNYQANPPIASLGPIEELKKQQADLTFILMINGVI